MKRYVSNVKLGQAMAIARGTDWVVSRYHDYLGHRDLEAERDALVQIMTRPKRIRTGTWSASASGTCGRARQFAFLGMPQKRIEERTRNIFANGDYVHLRHQAVGLVAGYVLDTEVSVAVADLSLTGTMDGLLANGAIAEFKSINSYGFGQVMSFGAKDEHVMQIHGYMLATGIDEAHAVYENKDTNALKEFVVRRDEKKIAAVVADLKDLNEATAEKRLLPMLPECRNFKGRYNYCPYANICEDASWPTDS